MHRRSYGHIILACVALLPCVHGQVGSRAIEVCADEQELRAAAQGLVGEFGASVAIGSTGQAEQALVAVGMPRAVRDGVRRGAVRWAEVDARSSGVTSAATLTVATLGEGARFGAAVNLRAGRLLVGAPGAGRVFAYDLDRVPGTAPVTVLGPAVGSFGATIAVAADGWIAVAAPHARVGDVPHAGEVHLFEPQASGYRLARILRAPEPTVAGGFGAALAFVGMRLAVGAPGADHQGPGSGAVFTFERAGGLAWSLDPSGVSLGDVHSGARFGASLATLGQSAMAIGVPGRGAVCLIDASTGVVDELALLRRPAAGGFGVAVAAAGSVLVVGEPWAAGGVAHRYRVADGSASLVETLRPRRPASAGEFGASLGVVGARHASLIVVGDSRAERACGSAPCRVGAAVAFIPRVLRAEESW